MIIPRSAPPSRITILHRDAEKAEGMARGLRLAGHQIHIIQSGKQVERAIVDSVPDLLIASGSFLNPPLGPLVHAVRQRLGELPLLVLEEEARIDSLVEADATLREPVSAGDLAVAVAGLLRPHGEIRALQEKLRQLQGLYRISWSFSLETGAEGLFGELAKQGAELLKARKGVVLLYDEPRRQMVGQLDGYGLTPEQVAAFRYGVDVEARSHWNFRKNGPLVSNKARTDRRLLREMVEGLDMDALVAVPLTHGNRILGLLVVGDRPGKPFGDEDLNLLLAAAAEGAVAVENLRLHEEIKRANALLQEYDRLKSEFVAIVAHDFRRPLMAIRGYAEMVLEEAALPREERDEYLRTVIRETDALAVLADDTLLITHMETGDFQFRWSEIDLGPFILESVPLGLSDHSVLMDVPREVPRIVGDPDRLRQVLTNLVGNAIAYSPGGGSITVRCRPRGLGHVAIEVIDSGLGIPADQIGKLFQKFQRIRTEAHLSIPGTGLGLYICRLIVEGHDGQIWVESEPGKGSTFGLVLPLDARRTRKERRQREQEAASAGPGVAKPGRLSAEVAGSPTGEAPEKAG